MSSTVWCICIASTKKTKRLGGKNSQAHLSKRKEANAYISCWKNHLKNHSFIQFDPFKIRSSPFSWMKKLKSDAKKKKKGKTANVFR